MVIWPTRKFGLISSDWIGLPFTKEGSTWSPKLFWSSPWLGLLSNNWVCFPFNTTCLLTKLTQLIRRATKMQGTVPILFTIASKFEIRKLASMAWNAIVLHLLPTTPTWFEAWQPFSPSVFLQPLLANMTTKNRTPTPYSTQHYPINHQRLLQRPLSKFFFFFFL